MSPAAVRPKYLRDRELGQLLADIANSDCSARSVPFITEAANRLQDRGGAPTGPVRLVFQRLLRSRAPA